MKLPRRQFVHLAAGAAALPVVSRMAHAQAYPTRPITMILPIAAGSSSDVGGRLVAERMGTALGQPIIIENVPGADGSIGVGRVARARPDGYTIEFGYLAANVLNGALTREDAMDVPASPASRRSSMPRLTHTLGLRATPP